MTARILIGDCRDVLRSLPDESVHCCVTSPPYYGLRDYGVGGQIGLEPSPAEFVAAMVEVFRQVRRVLRSDGTLWLNLGDSYVTRHNGSIGRSTLEGAVRPHAEHRRAHALRKTHQTPVGLKHKDLMGIPWRVAFALQEDGWYLRRDIVWHKPNPMPESVQDRPTTAHEFIFLMSKNQDYFYDFDAVKERVSGTANPRKARGPNSRENKDRTPTSRKMGERSSGVKANASFEAETGDLVEFRNMRTVWTVASEPFRDAHFATYPPALIEPCILAGCPVGGTVLDPFGGAGTTGLVSERLGRDSILIELNPEYAALAEARIREDRLGPVERSVSRGSRRKPKTPAPLFDGSEAA